MNRDELIRQIEKKKSFLCVGLDTDLKRLPDHLPRTIEGALEFNRAIIEATAELCVAYKPNIAFYEAMGPAGWELLAETIRLVPNDCLTIADAKRGDIGNTASLYARAFFEELGADAITLSPYMGADSIRPFLAYEGKWVIVLGLTSNPSASDFETFGNEAERLFERVIRISQEWAGPDRLMFVAGATQTAELERIRQLAPENFLLVPGVGAQGGSLSEVCDACLLPEAGILVNSTRGIIYASGGEDFAEVARQKALELQREMAGRLLAV